MEEVAEMTCIYSHIIIVYDSMNMKKGSEYYDSACFRLCSQSTESSNGTDCSFSTLLD